MGTVMGISVEMGMEMKIACRLLWWWQESKRGLIRQGYAACLLRVRILADWQVVHTTLHTTGSS